MSDTETIARPTATDLAALPVGTRLATGEWTAWKQADGVWKLTGTGGYATSNDKGTARTLHRNARVTLPR